VDVSALLTKIRAFDIEFLFVEDGIALSRNRMQNRFAVNDWAALL